MKSVFKTLLTFFLILFLGTAVGVLITAQFLTVLGMTAGNMKNAFVPEIICKAFFIIAPVVLMSAGFLLALYAIRHRVQKIASAITYIILCAVTWTLLLPVFWFLQDKCEQTLQNFSALQNKLEQTQTQNDLDDLSKSNKVSRNYFRQADNIIFYSTNQTNTDSTGNLREAENSTTITINTESANPVQELKNISRVDAYKILKTKSYPFNDILVEKSFNKKNTNLIFKLYATLVETAHIAYKDGLISWLFFVAFGFALCSTYAFVAASSWKLINSITVIFANIFICAYNFLYYTNAPAGLKNWADSWGGFFRLIDEPFLFCANFSVGILFSIIGFVVFLTKSKE